LEAHGVDPDKVTAADLYTRGLDCQNLGGYPNVELIAEAVARVEAPGPDDQVLDVGCGIGGPSRFIADRFGCRVMGVDLVRERTDAARSIAEMTGLADRVEYRAADATALPLEDASFTQLWMMDTSIHVRDKARLFMEIARVLRPGGLLVVHDQMGPLPRAMLPAKRRAPFIAPSLARFMRLVEDAGFRLVLWQDTTQQILEFFYGIRDLSSSLKNASGLSADPRQPQILAIVTGYIETLESPTGRTGLLVARRAQPLTDSHSTTSTASR
jgi:SAM-dependent methyltransferase